MKFTGSPESRVILVPELRNESDPDAIRTLQRLHAKYIAMLQPLSR
jgi:hypothetical protein